MVRSFFGVFALLVAVAGAALPAAVSAQDFETVDLTVLERLLLAAEAAGEDPDPEQSDTGREAAPGTPRDAQVAVGGGDPPTPESDAAFVRRLLERLRARDASGGQLPPDGAGARSGFLSIEEQAVLDAVTDRLGLGPDAVPRTVRRFHLAVGTSSACVRSGHAAYGSYPGVGGVLPPAGSSARLSANPLPVGGPAAWMDARAAAPGCGPLGWSAAFDVGFSLGLFAGVAVSGTSATHQLTFDGEVPSLVVWGSVHPFSGSAVVASTERRLLARAGWRRVVGNMDFYGVLAAGRASVALEVGADVEGFFYEPGGVPSYSGGVQLPQAPTLVVTDARRGLPAVQLGGGFTRWLSGFIGAGVEVSYFKTFGAGDVGRSGVDGGDGSGVRWSYRPHGWSADAGLRVRF